MIYQYIAPHPSLREFVRDFLIADFEFDKNEPVPFKAFSPRPELAITFLPNSKLTRVNLSNGESHASPSASICGQQITRYNFHIPHNFQMIRVNFHPGALYRLIGIPLYEFTNSWYDAGLVINHEIIEVNERLSNCNDYVSMIRLVEEYLQSKIDRVDTDTHPVDRIAEYILSNPARNSLDWLANQACLSPRQFNRKFKERIGVGPKLFSRIVRFFNAYKYKESHLQEDWLSVALQFGYTDYQHLVRDSREFACATPNIWIRQDNHSPEKILKLQ